MRNPQDSFACLIPKPASIFESQENFLLSPNTRILLQKDDNELSSIGNLLAGYIREATGKELPVEDSARQAEHGIHLTLESETSLGDEGYDLSITKDSVQLSASCPAGLFYGAQTLRQLFPTNPSSTVSLPGLSIRDRPRFE
jgi:hexosaminidase